MYNPEYHRAYYQANKEKKREQGRIWEANNKDKVKAYRIKRIERLKKENPELLYASTRKWEKNNPEKVLFRSAKARSVKYKLDFNIEIEDVVIPEYCPLLGIKLEPREGGHGPKDSSPSLDRIDNTKGYIKGNVWVVSWLANKMKATATNEQLLTFSVNVQSWLGKGAKDEEAND
jgi:hypothetical protein